MTNGSEKSISEIKPLEYWCWIKAKDNSTQIAYGVMEWRGMTYEQFAKWKWYFRYRCALLQIQYPRLEAEIHWGSMEPDKRTEKNILENRIRAKKGKITEVQNKINKAIKEWNEIFPIEQDPLWPRAVGKLERLKEELKLMQKEYENISGTIS